MKFAVIVNTNDTIGNQPSPLHAICGKAMIDWVIEAFLACEMCGRLITVTNIDAVAAHIDGNIAASIEDAMDELKPDFDAIAIAGANMPFLHFYVSDEDMQKQFAKSKLVDFTKNDDIPQVNNYMDLAEAHTSLKLSILDELMFMGVSIIDPFSTYIESGVEIGQDTIIYPNTYIHSDVKIGTNCRVGPFAYIRPHSVIGDNVKVGDFVEIKNSTIGDNTKISHLTYVGDADVGQKVNFGCGTVLVNYDGKAKHRSTICDNAFIGCNTNLVSPVTVGEGAYTAAGSTITKNVPAGSLAIAREKQSIKEGWATKKLSR